MNSRDLCMALMRADTSEEVVQLLTDEGYWDDPSLWRYIGDNDTNWSTIGNQQSEAVAALVEKVVNSVDARLMNACLVSCIDPEAESAPKTIRDAVARLFEGKAKPDLANDGRISQWSNERLTEEGRLLTVAATGNMPQDGYPSISIADKGEGQQPDRFPDTLCSLLKGNKKRIPFVQGKFNMGGTGALRHCVAPHRLQLIVSRRNPALLGDSESVRGHEWGFTIVRREPPSGGARNSVYSYLAPLSVDSDRDGRVLSFAAESWPIFPEADKDVREAYARMSEHGTLVKLYEYEWKSTRSNIVSSGGGLLRKLDLGLPELALPVRVFECRSDYKGHSGSFATNVLGLVSRLDRDKADKLEDGFPLSNLLRVANRPVSVRVYAFKKGAASDYRTSSHGVVFSVNGQSHASFSIDFFRRKKVGMSYLSDSLLVMLDCSDLDEELREDLFMNSRDRLIDGRLKNEIEENLEGLLKEDQALRHLRNRRREEDLAEKLDSSQPLVDVLEDLLELSPTLAKLFLSGQNLPSPFPRAGTGDGGTASDFEGKPYPTYFRFRGLKEGEGLNRTAEVSRKVRLSFETDAEDTYFVRELDTGRIECHFGDSEERSPIDNLRLNGPKDGLAHLTFSLPADAEVGSSVRVEVEVTDPSRVEPFLNISNLTVSKKSERSSGRGGPSRTGNQGKGNKGSASVLALPNIIPVSKNNWEQYGFDELSAVMIKHAGSGDSEDVDVYDFFVNTDNKYLRRMQKESREDPKLIEAKFIYASVLISLGLLRESDQFTSRTEDSEQPGFGIEDVVLAASRAIAPVLLPTIETIGGLSDELIP